MLSIRFPYALVAGHGSIVHLQLENHGVNALEHGEILLEGRSLVGLCRKTFRRIPPGHAKSFSVEIDPVRAGPSILQLQLIVEDADGRRAYRGACAEPVHAAPDGNINISIGDIQSNRGPGANAGLGADYGNVSISNLLGDSRPPTLNDLLNTERDDVFRRIELDLDYGLSAVAVRTELAARGRSLSLPADYWGQVQAASRCVLEPPGGDSTGRITLVTGPEFKLGRNRQESDFVTWWWPRSPEADEKTRRISQVHIRLMADADGLWLWDNGSANGTLCDGQPLPAGDRGTATRFERVAALAVAHDYLLDVEHVPSAIEGRMAIRGIERWNGPAESAPPRNSGSVSFTPRACATPPFTGLWLLTDASFGSSAANVLNLPDAGLAEVQGRFHWYRGCFWIESIAANDALRLNQRILRAGEIAPLTTGMRLALGDRELRVACK